MDPYSKHMAILLVVRHFRDEGFVSRYEALRECTLNRCHQVCCLGIRVRVLSFRRVLEIAEHFAPNRIAPYRLVQSHFHGAQQGVS